MTLYTEWLRDRAKAPNMAAYKGDLLSIANAMETLQRDITAAEARNKRLEEALRRLIRGYVLLLECGRDRIVDLGGQCDSLEQMEREDSWLREARAALEPTP